MPELSRERYLALKTGAPILPVYIEDGSFAAPEAIVDSPHRLDRRRECIRPGAENRTASESRSAKKFSASGAGWRRKEGGRAPTRLVWQDASYNGQASGSVIIGATKFQSGDIVEIRSRIPAGPVEGHPMGMDIRMKCTGCGHSVLARSL